MTDYIDFIDSNGSEWTRTSRFREAKETIAAQAAVIEKLREALSVAMWFAPNHPTLPENKRRFDILKATLAIPTDSTQILDEVRRAERERVAQMFEESGIGGDHLAAAIRAME